MQIDSPQFRGPAVGLAIPEGDAFPTSPQQNELFELTSTVGQYPPGTYEYDVPSASWHLFLGGGSGGGSTIVSTSPGSGLTIADITGGYSIAVDFTKTAAQTDVATAQSNAESYADSAATAAAGSAQTAAESYADGKDATNLTAAKSYADTKDSANLQAAETYADTKDTANLASAKSYTDAQIASLINSAPGTLDTLNEIAEALGNDPNFAATMTQQLALKLNITDFNTTIANYSTTTQMNSAIATAVANVSAGYVTSESLSATLAGYVTSSALSTQLANYSTTTQMNSAISSALASYSTTTQMNTAISTAVSNGTSGLATTTSVTTGDATTLASAKTYADGGDATNLATAKAYTDTYNQNSFFKQPVLLVLNANVSLTAMPVTQQGVTVVNGSRVLLTAQTDATQNGLYTCGSVNTTATLTRATDANTSASIANGFLVFAEGGTFINTSWQLTTIGATLGTTQLAFAQFGLGGTPGTGLLSSNGKLSLDLANYAPYDMSGSNIGNMPTSTSLVMAVAVARKGVIPANFAGSYAYADTAATASYTFTIKQNGTAIGTIVFGAGAAQGSFTPTTINTAITFNAGDKIEVFSAASADSTLANVYFVINANLT